MLWMQFVLKFMICLYLSAFAQQLQTVVLGTTLAVYPAPPEDFGVWTKVYLGSCSRQLNFGQSL